MDLLKYAAEFDATHTKPAVADMHPAMFFTRLGAVLRKHAVGSGDLGLLARAAVTNGGHPEAGYDVTPLAMLRDWTQDNPEHELATKFNWSRLPEKVQLDLDLPHHINTVNRGLPAGVVNNVTPNHVTAEPSRYYGRFGDAVRAVFYRLRDSHPWATAEDVQNSAKRWLIASENRGQQTLRNDYPHVGGSAENDHDDLAEDRHGPQVAFLHPDHPERY